MEEGREQEPGSNLAWWQEAALLHADSDFYDLDAVRSGRDFMRPFEVDELGDVSGRDLVHLQCHIGTDTVSWARRGARVVGLDFSSNAVDIARALAAECEVPVGFVCADVLDAPIALDHRRFDVVYTGVGALNWLPDLDAWAGVVYELLRPGGVFYLSEIHPLVFGLSGDGRSLVHDIHAAAYGSTTESGGTYAVPDAELSNRTTFERAHSVSEVLSAVLDCGLTLELVHEHSYTNAPWPWLIRGDDKMFRLPDGWPRYPLAYSVRARRQS
ncbi:MAG TPA: class I SAM-dependent methyltransferase [Acidimicrobiales bacterium]|nr:class I SAM-dependent methyltransferase [Acidimicrobiales bacterium]